MPRLRTMTDSPPPLPPGLEASTSQGDTRHRSMSSPNPGPSPRSSTLLRKEDGEEVEDGGGMAMSRLPIPLQNGLFVIAQLERARVLEMGGGAELVELGDGFCIGGQFRSII